MNKPRIGDDEALPLGGTIGILGGGQLGRMLALAASPLGFRCHVYSATTGPAFDVCVEGMTAKYEDRAALAEFAKSVDVVTYEFENHSSFHCGVLVAILSCKAKSARIGSVARSFG